MTDECLKCGTTDRELEEHHIRPRAVGGRDREDNLAALCKRCHRFAPGPSVSDTVEDYHQVFAEYVRTRARPEYDLLRFGITAGDRLPSQAADAVGLLAVGADREHTSPKRPAGIWLLGAVLSGYGSVERLVDLDTAGLEQLVDE